MAMPINKGMTIKVAIFICTPKSAMQGTIQRAATRSGSSASHESPLKGVQCLVRGDRGHGLETLLHRDQGRTRGGERLLRWPLGGIPVAGGLLEFKTNFFEGSTQLLAINRLNVLPRRRDR